MASWWRHLESKVVNWGVQVVGLTSDRARGLVQLGKQEYFNVRSMPDLFHFAQDMGKAVGCRIGQKKAQLQKKLDKCRGKAKKAELEVQLSQVTECQRAYRQQVEQVNKTVHPFDNTDEWRQEGQTEEGLLKCIKQIGSIATNLGIEFALEKAMKITNQIPDIAASLQAWQQRIKEELQQWAHTKAVPDLHRQWVEKCALPYAYWQLQLNKTQARARNKDLRAYYKQRAEDAQRRYAQHCLTAQLEEQARQYYLEKAFGMAATFQRSSSQVEGRNGYLAFVHHAYKGIPKHRLAALTVVHNFDIRRGDGTTPAQRLFSKEFPDLFEFLCHNVTGFAEPRRRRRRPLDLKAVQL